MAPTSAARAPGTIREMLLWLYYFGQKDGGQQLQKFGQGFESLLQLTLSSVLNSNGGNDDASDSSTTGLLPQLSDLLKNACNDAGKILVTIEKGDKYHDDNNKGELEKALKELKTEAQDKKFEYNEDPMKLYPKLRNYVYQCYWQLRFLYLRCNTHTDVGGWGQCKYGRGIGAVTDRGSGQSSSCGQHSQRCDHCSKDYKGCLISFLAEGSNGDHSKYGNNIYKDAQLSVTSSDGADSTDHNKTIAPMGFDVSRTNKGAAQGSHLHGFLYPYFKDHKQNFPKLLGMLTLQEFAVMSSQDSDSDDSAVCSWRLADLWAFWIVFRKYWKEGHKDKKEKQDNKVEKYREAWKKKFKEELQKNGEQYEWKPEAPDTILRALFKATHEDSHNSLKALTTCDKESHQQQRGDSQPKCGKYLHGLLEQPFEHVVDAMQPSGLLKHLVCSGTLITLAKLFFEKFGDFNSNHFAKTACIQNVTKCQSIVFCETNRQ